MAHLATPLAFPLGGDLNPGPGGTGIPPPYGPTNALGAPQPGAIQIIGPTDSTPPTAGVIIQVFPGQL